MRCDITPGAAFPDCALPDHIGRGRTLSELQGRDPLIVVLSRGHRCPEEYQHHLELAAFQSKLAAGCARMVTISTDAAPLLREFRASVDARWTFLSDPGRTVQLDLDIQDYTDPENDPMVPYTFVLKPGLVIHAIYNGYWLWGRPTADDLWLDLRAVSQEIRPDWDLGTPGLRAAWTAGDRFPFDGWAARQAASQSRCPEAGGES
jgi:peroxiredoxin